MVIDALGRPDLTGSGKDTVTDSIMHAEGKDIRLNYS